MSTAITGKLQQKSSGFFDDGMEGNEEAEKPISLEEVYLLSWWIFDASFRSIVLDLDLGNNLNCKLRSDVGTVDFLRVVSKLVANSVKTIAKCIKLVSITSSVQFNACIGTFLLDLLSVCDRGHVIDMIWTYVTEGIYIYINTKKNLFFFSFRCSITRARVCDDINFSSAQIRRFANCVGIRTFCLCLFSLSIERLHF
jgi:hypothetical protein